MGRRMFGSIRKLPSGKYQARYAVAERGGQVYSAPHTFQTIDDADTWLGREKTKLADGTWTPPKQAAVAQVEKVAITFEEYSKKVLARRKLGDRTREEYENMRERLMLPKFGKLPLTHITPSMVRDWYGTMHDTPTQQANTYGLFKSILAEAIKDELLDKNPCNIEGGSQKHAAKEAETITPDEFKKYLANVPDRFKAAYLLTFWCGLRSGEIRGLRRKDLDLKEGTVTIAQSVTKLVGKPITAKSTKTRAGTRIIYLPPKVTEELKAWIKNQPVMGQDAYLFTARDGKTPLSDKTFYNMHRRASKAIKRPGLTPHGLRHSAATLSAQLGATTKELMEKFGWSDPAMAARYTHSTKQRQQELAEKLSNLA